MTNEQMCPYEPGDVIWYVFAMPGSDYIARLVLAKNGGGYLAYGPFLEADVSAKWHPNTGQSIGDSGLHKEATVPKNDQWRGKPRCNAELDVTGENNETER